MRKYLYGISAFVLAFAILSVSVLRSCLVPRVYGYATPPPIITTVTVPTPTPFIDYVLTYPGGILPDNWLWYFKAARDKAQYMITSDSLKKAELSLLYSDKRLGASKTLFENKKYDIAASTLSKGEKYLEQAVQDELTARKAGIKTNDFLIKLANASLRHKQIIEQEVLPLSPEDIKPGIVKAEDYSKNAYKSSRDALSSSGIIAPKDPFNSP